MSKPALLALLLYFFQCFLIVHGREVFGRDGNPFLLFAVSVFIPILYLRYCSGGKVLEQKQIDPTKPFKMHCIGFIIGCSPLLILLPVINNMFHEFADYTHSSDVITQLDTQYTRWRSGVFPYHPLEQYDWHPYPVYMPLNWLPLAIPHWLHIDVRWVGILFLAIANGIWGSYVWTPRASNLIKTTCILLPPAAFMFYIVWARFDISVSLETIIAAYYLVLASGLTYRKIWLASIGIILCLLSRYTMVFWLPLFAILLWINQPLKISLWVWAGVIAALFLIYVLPFYSHDPTILSKGIKYHNGCAIGEWECDNKNVAWTFYPGIYFAPYLKQIFSSGSMEHRVFMARVVQAILMLALCFGGIFLYLKKKTKIDFYDFSLGFLYLIVLFFYFFSPLLYKYYLIVLLTISAVLTAKVLLKQTK